MSMRLTLALVLIVSVSLATGCASKSGSNRLLSSFGLSSNAKSASGPFGDAKYKGLADKVRADDSSGSGALATAKAAQDSIGGALKKATATVTETLAIKPKVIPANDPISLSSTPDKLDAGVYYQAGRLAEHNGDLTAAAKQYQRALDEDPKDVRTLISMARLHDRKERYEEAIQLYQRATEAAPKNAMAHNDMGLCYARQQRNTESVNELQLAVALEPSRKLYRNNLATVLVEMGKDDQAWKTLRDVHTSAVANYNLGYLLNRSDRKKEARQRFALAWQADPSMSIAKSMLDQLDAQLGVTPSRTAPVATNPAPRRQSVPGRLVSVSNASGPPVTSGPPVSQGLPAKRRLPITPVSSPVQLRRTPAPSESPSAPASNVPASNVPNVQLRSPVPVTSSGPAQPVVKPAVQPLPQPTNLRFPIRTLSAYSVQPSGSDGDLDLPTPNQLDDPAVVLAGEPGLLSAD